MDLIFSIEQEIRKEEDFLTLKVSEKGSDKVVYGSDLLAFALQEKLLGLGNPPKDLPCEAVSVQGSAIFPLVKKLAAARRLYAKGRALFWNPFSKASLRLEAEEEGKSLLVTGSLTLDGVTYPFSALDFLFQDSSSKAPMWGICKQMLFILEEEIQFSYLEKIYPGGVILEGKEKEAFMDAYLEDAPRGFPEISWKLSEETKMPVFPVLLLKDPYGAFASLQMEYEERTVDFDDTRPFHRRDLEAERAWEKDLLETGFLRKDLGKSKYYCPMDQVKKALSFLLDLGWNIFDAKGKRVLKLQSSSLSLEEDGKEIAIRGKFQYGEHTASLADVVEGLSKKSLFVDLGECVGWLQGPGYEEVADLAIAERMGEGLRLPKRHLGCLEALEKKEEGARVLLAKVRAFEEEEDPLFQGTLLPYQQEGKKWLSFLHKNGFSGLLADEMGLGKTVQTLSFLSSVKVAKPILLVVPTSLLFNWKREWEKFIPHRSLHVYEGKKRGGLEGKEAILTSYAYLRLDQEVFSKLSFSWVVLDEAQAIKNPSSALAQAAYALKSEGKLALTGTPIENRADDLWSLFHFLERGLLGERKSFLENPGRASRLLKPFILRRTKEQVLLDLPEKFEQEVWVDLKEEQKALYGTLLHKARHNLKLESRIEILEAILRLRQICCDPRLIGQFVESAKLERVLSDLEEVLAENRKVLIYSQFTQMLKLLEGEIKQRGWAYSYLDGETKDREAAVDRFQRDPTVSIFLISLKAGGVGLNLTAADYVFLFDPWWNEAAEKQALARTHRLGRKGTVIARRYLTAGTLEEKMMQLKMRKSALAKGLLEFEESAFSFGDMQELLTPLDSSDLALEDLQLPP